MSRLSHADPDGYADHAEAVLAAADLHCKTPCYVNATCNHRFALLLDEDDRNAERDADLRAQHDAEARSEERP